MHRMLALTCIVLALAGCSLLRPTPAREMDTNTPEGAAMQYIAATAPQSDAAEISFAPIRTWPLGQDHIVAFSYAGGYGDAWQRCNGQARVALGAGGWLVTEAGTRCWDDPTAAITGVYAIITGNDDQEHTFVYGDILVPEVTAVSIEFDIGGENAVAEKDAAAYWLLQPGGAAPVRAYAINELGNLVQQIDFGAPLALTTTQN